MLGLHCQLGTPQVRGREEGTLEGSHPGMRLLQPSIPARQRKTDARPPKSCWTPSPPLVGTLAKVHAAIWAWPKPGRTSAPFQFPEELS